MDQKGEKEKETLNPTQEAANNTSMIDDDKRISEVVDGENYDLKGGQNVCKHKRLCRLVNGKFLMKVTEKMTGMRLVTCGDSWPESKLGKTCIVEGGEETNVLIKWITSDSEMVGDVESYSTSTNQFKFYCKRGLCEPKCLNCKMPESRCLKGKSVLMSANSLVGRKVKACGNLTSTHLNQRATILGENKNNEIMVLWDKTNDEETHSLITGGMHNFEFDCSAPDSCVLHRLPVRKIRKDDLLNHAASGETHRIKFSTSENILLTGLGFLVAKTIDRVYLIVSHQLQGCNDYVHYYAERPFEKVGSSESTVVLKLRKQLALRRDRIYLLTVDLHGGASIVGHGGKEFNSVVRGGDKEDVRFKFKKCKNIKYRTDMEKGVIEKIFFHVW